MPVTIHDLRAWKAQGKRFSMLTAYDFPTARILDDAGIPVLLVGDSVANNVLGYPDTLPVTMDEMLHHTRAVARGASEALVVGDLPFLSYQVSIEEGVRNAGPLPEGGRRRGREARGTADRAHPPARRARHPGDGARRAHAAVGQRDGRVPRPGPGRRRVTGARGGAVAREGRRVRDRPGGDAGRARRRDHALDRDPDDRHRRRPGHRRPGPRLPRPRRA